MGRRRCATTRVIAAKTERAEVAVKSRVQLFDALAVFELLEYREFHVLRLFLDEAELGNVARRVDVVLVVSELRCQHNTTATCCCNMLHESVFSFLRQLTAWQCSHLLLNAVLLCSRQLQLFFAVLLSVVIKYSLSLLISAILQ